MDWADSAGAGNARLRSPEGIAARLTALPMASALLPLAAFVLYWASSFIVVADSRQYLFGSDAVLYTSLARDDAAALIGGNFHLDRITRFHPATTALALVWMKLLGPLLAWVMSPQQLLRAMSAFVGAVGVWAAMAAFAHVVPRRQVALWGIVYAASLGPWFFSSIEESKIVTATLAALYIVAYLRLRSGWSVRGAALLTAILLVACLNEIMAAFLLAIPAVDTLVLRGWDLGSARWIAGHALAAPVAFVLLETVVHHYTGDATAEGPAGEAVSHVGMLAFYLGRNDFSVASLYGFLANWLLFPIAAPTPATTFAALPAHPEFKGYFEPTLAGYVASPVSATLALLFATMLAASLWPRLRRGSIGHDKAGVLLGLGAYTLARGAFCFVVYAREGFLFASPATLAHLLALAALFAASRFPAPRTLLAACALLLLVVNGTFIIGR